jgi:histone acetyltransferase 1
MDHEETTQLRILSDEPSLSSAALCTTLHLLDNTFHPEFTHQCLPLECYRGHRPEESRITSQPLHEPGTLLHKSHRFHDSALYTLHVEIQLAPSCRQCRILVHRTRHDHLEQEPIAKKPRQEMEPMTEEEIKAFILKALPNITKDEDCSNDFCDEPIGTILAEYSRHGQDFVVTVADGITAAEYHAQVQKLALWFIENADDVNVGDDQSGFWNVIYLFHKTSDKKKYSLAGYITLFHFHVPFHKPVPGIIARVCQALVFPPYQGQGHGTRLMECVYDLAHGKHTCYPHHIVQVNVEDPSPGFIFLRNIVDFQYLMRRENRSWWPKIKSDTAANTNDVDDDIFLSLLLQGKDAFSALSEADASNLSTKAKITSRQVQLVHELLHLQAVLGSTNLTAGTSPDPELETRFRLMVKKRLNREHKEEMTLYPTKEEKKAFLSRLYDDYIDPYKKWMTRRQKAHSHGNHH